MDVNMQSFTESSSNTASEDPKPSLYAHSHFFHAHIYSSGMFSGAQHVAVTGHSLINTTNYYTTAATVPSDVRMVPLSDINLQQEIHLDSGTGVVDRHRIQLSVRRIYSAKVRGQSTTVAMYQGRDAEEEWRQELAKYGSIRQVLQLGRLASESLLSYSWSGKFRQYSQANYIFSRLHMTSNFEDYGFLLLCPEKDFQIGPSSFCWPDCPTYWSLDPSGVERLSTEEAAAFGFPSLELTTRIGRYTWDASVYAGIREFQRAKGFDPESQDVARHLEWPLFYPCNEADAPFAHVNEEEEYSSDEDDEDQTDAEGRIIRQTMLMMMRMNTWMLRMMKTKWISAGEGKWYIVALQGHMNLSSELLARTRSVDTVLYFSPTDDFQLLSIDVFHLVLKAFDQREFDIYIAKE
ncbi:hypothetical protein B0H19DRAFT_1066686 [Mycena capillaripes]|nr:hypothetical protein B0H19DRAFT_1066686 [Mycena capillaripes]